MSKRKPCVKYIVIGLAVVLLAGGVIAANANINFWDKVAMYTAQILGGRVGDIEIPEPTLGASPSNVFMLPDITVNGVKTYYLSSKMVNGTSTTCFLKSPNATTTWIEIGSHFKNATSVAAWAVISTSTTQYNTSTGFYMAENTSVAGNEFSILASTSPPINGGAILGDSQKYVFWKTIQPNTYIVTVTTSFAGTGGAVNNPNKGQCWAVLREVYTP